MNNNNYYVSIDKVFAGKLVNINGKVCRTILFTIDNDGKANDLLYDSPRYPICDDNEKNIHFDGFIVKDYVSLQFFLNYFEYDCVLDLLDIIHIKNYIFCSSFVEEYDYLFGTSKEYNLFKEMAARNIIESLKERMPMSTFHPSREEGKIKRLRVFKTY